MYAYKYNYQYIFLKGESFMKLNFLKKVWRPGLMLLLSAVMAVSVVSWPQAAASTYKASSINRLEGLEVDYTDYLVSSVI